MNSPSSVPRCVAERPQSLRWLMGLAIVVAVLLNPVTWCHAGEGPSRADSQTKAANSCGPVALQALFSVLGHSTERTLCAQLAGTDTKGVTMLAGLQKASQALGYRCRGMRLTSAELAFLNKPTILHVSPPSSVDDHFVVFTSAINGRMEVVDPQRQHTGSYTPDQLRMMWKGDCLVFTESPAWTALRVGVYRCRLWLVFLVGLVVGCLAAGRVIGWIGRAMQFGERSVDGVNSHQSALAVVSGLAAVGAIAATTVILWSMRHPGTAGPRLVIGISDVNIGELDWGTPAVLSFWVGNAGSEGLEIDPNGIKKPCGCMRTVFSKTKLKPGDKAEFSIRIVPLRKMGPFQYSMYIPTKDPQGGQVLTVLGKVVGPGCVIYPPRLYFGRVTCTGAGRSLAYVLRRPDVRVLDAKSNVPYVLCEKDRCQGGFKIDATLDALPQSGPFAGTIEIQTDDPHTPKHVIPFSGIAEPHRGHIVSATETQ